MRVLVEQVGNGWVVRPFEEDRGTMILLESIMVFNTFEDLANYLKKISGKK